MLSNSEGYDKTYNLNEIILRKIQTTVEHVVSVLSLQSGILEGSKFLSKTFFCGEYFDVRDGNWSAGSKILRNDELHR
jgi:hypothetical protein